ncbi:MAG: DUF1697 domain-containing protein [Actinomycetia bacterium]|nr:DUF1697 domain-containing protein [Actinomycetes bacterium]MCP4222583.1 DUF1697 domain-containing protein [Actinomycetes bacterium]MCP5035522.1 DUF1697 domain-containing protein [Actinomycetes bacterium]
MTDRSVAFLRGINVGGHRVTKDELIAVFTSLGFERVDTFLASGNVLFEPTVAVDEAVIGEALEASLGYGVPTTVRSAGEIATLATAAPFSDDELSTSDGKPQVILLFEQPPSGVEATLIESAPDEDKLVFDDRAIHWLPSAGVSTSALDLAEMGRLAGTHTIRTVNTIRRLVPKL